MKKSNPPSSYDSSKTICIVQLNRFGDLLQTYQAAVQVKKYNPNITLKLIARKQFASDLIFLLKKAFDKVIMLDLKSILYKNSIENKLPRCLSQINSFVNSVNDENITVCVNLSYSKTSNWLCGMINASYKLGPYYDLSS